MNTQRPRLRKRPRRYYDALGFVLVCSSCSGYSAPKAWSAAPSFVITGGPCSGKTTAIAALPSEVAGWDLLKVPEAATLYFERGGHFPFATPPDASGVHSPADRNLLWEGWLVELKLSLENHAQSAAAADKSHRTALLCDRGIFDSRAYLPSDDEWRQLLSLGGWSEAELLSRYCGVALLDVAPSALYNLGNEARHESYSEALFRGDETWDAWCNAMLRVDRRKQRLDSELVVNSPSFSAGGAPSLRSPVRIANMGADGSDFKSKVSALQDFVTERLESLTAAASSQRRRRSGSGTASSTAGGGGGDRSSRWTMPIDFLVEQADLVATAPDLSAVYPKSVALLRDLQVARKGDSLRRRWLQEGSTRKKPEPISISTPSPVSPPPPPLQKQAPP